MIRYSVPGPNIRATWKLIQLHRDTVRVDYETRPLHTMFGSSGSSGGWNALWTSTLVLASLFTPAGKSQYAHFPFNASLTIVLQ